jgi:hypothetical protein
VAILGFYISVLFAGMFVCLLFIQLRLNFIDQVHFACVSKENGSSYDFWKVYSINLLGDLNLICNLLNL